MKKGLDNWLDIAVIVIYLMLVLGVGLWTLCRPNRGSVRGYFLAGRDMTWLTVGASLYASNIGSEHFIGLAGTGAASGLAIIMYEWASLPLVLLLSWAFVPVYISAGVYTLPEYLEKRFGGKRLRTYLTCLSLLLYVITKIVVCIYAGALFITLSLGWNMYLSIAVLLSVTCLYTLLGGLAAVMYTDTLQTIIMTMGAVALTIISFVKIGGYGALQRSYFAAVPASMANDSVCGRPRDDAFNLFRDPVTADNPWPGLILQASLGCLWYWCADQVIVQRTLAARNIAHAKGGSVAAGFLKLLPLYFMVFPGMISRALYPDDVGCVDPEECEAVCGNPVGCSNIAYPKLVMDLLPTGLRGLLLAVMMSAIMSSLTSIFNSASTLFTMDLWRRIRPASSERELLITGRVVILALCGVSVLWLPLVQSSAGGQLFVYIQIIQGYLGSPVGVLFLMSIFWKRMTEKATFWGILSGHAIGVARMVLEFLYPEPSCGDFDQRPIVLSAVHYTYFSQMNMLLTAAVVAVVSLCSQPASEEKLQFVTWTLATRSAALGLLLGVNEFLLPEEA
ncbi:hypothetical protein CAPTEDRAFT_199257 [Capitella teleta]|uniref:Uncharacterized protein n=1 Tax=Capitella teleta TaxID=283909 RepID=R7UCG2_CAPTE|nr:hypothetical protein CAPTEDRAFT_199257 [Capitella teleta]|eukprot:ELU03811.1 hypothetical protein CAPTEDRAFT_199257 [Capitella teleta]